MYNACSKALAVCEAAEQFTGEGQEQQRLKAAQDAARQWDEQHIGKPQETPSPSITDELIAHLEGMGIKVHTRDEMIAYLNKHGFTSIQEAIGNYNNSMFNNTKNTTYEKSRQQAITTAGEYFQQAYKRVEETGNRGSQGNKNQTNESQSLRSGVHEDAARQWDEQHIGKPQETPSPSIIDELIAHLEEMGIKVHTRDEVNRLP